MALFIKRKQVRSAGAHRPYVSAAETDIRKTFDRARERRQAPNLSPDKTLWGLMDDNTVDQVFEAALLMES